MSFAQPIAILLAALALPIIAFYILKVRLRRIPVSTNLFWKQIYDEKPPRSILQTLRHLLSLLAQLLLLILLVLAVADPFFTGQRLQARRIVLIVDGSASMRATDVSPSRFAAARAAAHDVISGLRYADEVAVVLAGSRPDVVLGLTSHAPTLRRAVDGLAPSDSPTDLTAAVALGQRLIGSRENGQVIVLTDGCTEVSPPPPSLPVVAFRCFGTPAANIGITQFQTRRSHADPLGYEVLVGVRNAAPGAVQCRLELSLDDLPVDIIPLTLKPEERWSRVIEKTSAAGGLLTATLTQIRPAESPDDADSRESRAPTDNERNLLAVDDTAWSILPARETQKVLVVSPGNVFLQKVFEANPLVSVQVRRDFPDAWPVDTVIVLHREVPSTLPPGPVIVVDPIGGCDQWDAGEVLENPIVTEQNSASPLMTHIRLDNVLMPEARNLRFRTPPKVLAGTLTGEPVYAEMQRPAGRCLVLSVNLDRSDLAFRTAFPIMMTNALAWFAGQADELEPSLSTGSLTSIASASDAFTGRDRIALRSPSGRVIPVPVSSSPEASVARIGPLDEAGVWSAFRIAAEVVPESMDRPDGAARIRGVAVNLASESETDLRPEVVSSGPGGEPVLATWLIRPLWFYLVLTVTGLMLVEWFLYQRRLIT